MPEKESGETEAGKTIEQRTIRRWKLGGAILGLALGLAGGAYVGDSIYSYAIGRLAEVPELYTEFQKLPKEVHYGVRTAVYVASALPAGAMGSLVMRYVFIIPGGIAALAKTRNRKD